MKKYKRNLPDLQGVVFEERKNLLVGLVFWEWTSENEQQEMEGNTNYISKTVQ